MNLSRNLSLMSAFLLACSSKEMIGPSGRFDHAAASFACGPADGPAVAIYLASEPITSLAPPGVYVRVYASGTIDEIRGRILPISSNANAAAWYHASGNEYEMATAGYLMVRSGSAGSTLEGSVDLQFPNAGHLSGEFHAEWIQTNVLCG